jgi:hypothetical protein
MLPGIVGRDRAGMPRRDWFPALRRLSLPIPLLLCCACGTADSAVSEESLGNDGGLLLDVQWERFRMLDVSREELAVRCDVAVLEAPSTESELRRLAYNIAGEIQALLGRERHLAVWIFGPDGETLLGVAFYSPLTESFQFRTTQELEGREIP